MGSDRQTLSAASISVSLTGKSGNIVGKSGSLEACLPALSLSQSSSESKELQGNNGESFLHLGPYGNEGMRY